MAGTGAESGMHRAVSGSGLRKGQVHFGDGGAASGKFLHRGGRQPQRAPSGHGEDSGEGADQRGVRAGFHRGSHGLVPGRGSGRHLSEFQRSAAEELQCEEATDPSVQAGTVRANSEGRWHRDVQNRQHRAIRVHHSGDSGQRHEDSRADPRPAPLRIQRRQYYDGV